MIAINAYSCRSTSLLLVSGGSISSIGAGVLRPFSLMCEHNVRRMNSNVDLSEIASVERLRWMGAAGVLGREFDVAVDSGEIAVVFTIV